MLTFNEGSKPWRRQPTSNSNHRLTLPASKSIVNFIWDTIELEPHVGRHLVGILHEFCDSVLHIKKSLTSLFIWKSVKILNHVTRHFIHGTSLIVYLAQAKSEKAQACIYATSLRPTHGI